MASVESYIQTVNIKVPTDYGAVVVYNATKHEAVLGISKGVTVPPQYVEEARRFGYEDHVNHGKVTVGQVLAANVEGLDKRDWQSILSGTSRYQLLEEAAGQLSIPW